MGQTGRRSIATHILAVKIALATTHFHGFGVAHQGPWNTSVNKGKKRRAGLREALTRTGKWFLLYPYCSCCCCGKKMSLTVMFTSVTLGNSQTNQMLDPTYDVPANSLNYLVDGPTVLDAHAQVNRRLNLTHLNRDAPALALAAYARHGAHDVSYRLCGGAAHPDALYLLSRHPGNLGDDAVLDRSGAAFSFQRALLVLSAVVGRLCAHAVSLLCPTLPTGEFAHPDSVLDLTLPEPACSSSSGAPSLRYPAASANSSLTLSLTTSEPVRWSRSVILCTSLG